MRQELMEILVCPMCKGELPRNGEREGDGEIRGGKLAGTARAEEFPVEDGSPTMLPPDLRD